jgi:Uma2 family endonuclease
MSRYIEIEVVERYMVPELPPTDLPYEDGVPLESDWHRLQINLLADSVRELWSGRTDFFVGGNMFLYFSEKQVKNRDYRGPDFFVVKDVDGTKPRKSWIAWAEESRLPNVIVELLSPSTAASDLGEKKDLYERTLRTPEYFCYDPNSDALHGWRLTSKGYEPIAANGDGRLWSDELGACVGVWQGEYLGVDARWIRLFGAGGDLTPIRAEAEKARADAAERENARLREQLQRMQGK